MSSARRVWPSIVGAALFAAVLLAACAAPSGPASKPASKNIQSKTQSRNATISSAIDTAQAAVSRLASAASTVDARVKGFGASAQLQQIERQLTSASSQVGQAQIDAVNNVSKTINEFIARIDSAAAGSPSGSPRQKALTQLSTKLRSVQTTLATAISASGETSPTMP